MANYVIIENRTDHFERIENVIKALDDHAFISPTSEKEDFNRFRKAYVKFLLHKQSENSVVELCSLLTGFNPDLFIIDFSLDNYSTNEYDEYGGIFRRDFVKKYYPTVKAIFLTIHPIEKIKPFMEPGDIYISKINSNSMKDLSECWKERFAFYLKKS